MGFVNFLTGFSLEKWDLLHWDWESQKREMGYRQKRLKMEFLEICTGTWTIRVLKILNVIVFVSVEGSVM